MSTALKLTGIAFVLALCAAGAVSATSPTPSHASVVPSLGDPDPADCPFCGGDPSLHIRRVVQMERVTMAISTQLFR
jgi:hypothetical protein